MTPANAERRRIRVVGEDRMCFDIDAETLEPLGVSRYDPWALSDPLPGYTETIHINEWSVRRNQQWRKEQTTWPPPNVAVSPACCARRRGSSRDAGAEMQQR